MHGMGDTQHSYMLSVTWTDGYTTQSSITLNSEIYLNLILFDVITSALSLDSSCNHICCVICYVFLSFSFSRVKQEQIISMLSVWGYVECENVFFCKIIWPRTLWNETIRTRGGPNIQTQKTWLTSDNEVNNQKHTWLVALIDKDSRVWECLFQQDDLIEEHLKSGW